jgi:predicted Zn-dependent protease
MIPLEKEPRFTQSMAAAFFDLSPGALRKKEIDGYFVSDDNENLSPKRETTEKGGYKHRRYSLYDIRRIAHALRAHGKMSNRQLRLVIMRIDSFAEPVFKRNRKNLYKVYRKPNVW